MSDQCPTCLDYLFGVRAHVCAPRWEVREEAESTTTAVFAHSAIEAAEKFTEDYENTFVEYSVAAGTKTLIVFVRFAPVNDAPRLMARPEMKFLVEGECIPHYTARLVSPARSSSKAPMAPLPNGVLTEAEVEAEQRRMGIMYGCNHDFSGEPPTGK